ncbi:peptidoglycan recognition protein 1 isoform X2 [Hippopotamus amphibius kiboko]|uniref:peptidoglycan recognition protein 1 isoform X2 n=1 Tax=Hippopotamus amphibius kiboko TaxID=575201 RepID=UPI00259784C7|nr:peptidoglycan recognition protein 1 isoform X2 [Hippopotamus amphibius kiboko]
MTRCCTLLAWALFALLGLVEAQRDSINCPAIVSRTEWSALESECNKRLQKPLRYVVVSHTAGSACDTPASCLRQVQNVQHYHVQTLGWCDVGYNADGSSDYLRGPHVRIQQIKSSTNPPGRQERASNQTMGSRGDLGTNPSSAPDQLCDLRQMLPPL